VDGTPTTKILKNCTLQSNGTNWHIIEGVKSYTDQKLFTASTFTTGSLIVGGVEFSIVGSITISAATLVNARIVGTNPASRITTCLTTRQTHAAVPIFAGDLTNPSLIQTTFQPIHNAQTAFNGTYMKNTYELVDRTSGEVWNILLTTDGSINAHMTVTYSTPN
jgi:hypothetical protein